MYNDDIDDDRAFQTSGGSFRIPDKDFYRKSINTFGSVYNHLQKRYYVRSNRDKRIFYQPHYTSLIKVTTPYSNLANPADGICAHFLRRGFTKPLKIQFNAAVWSADNRWLVLGTQTGDLALWEGEALKVHKVISIPAHKEFYGDGDRIKENIPITAMAWKNYGNILVTGDAKGLIQYCDETFHNVFVKKGAHDGPIRGLSFSPLDSKLVSASDDGNIHLWTVGRDKPELTLSGHQNDIKCVDWHPYRSLVVSGSRDCAIKLWDPKQGSCVSTINGHKKQVNCCLWNKMNGNWLASGSMDGLLKVYDIRIMKEIEVFRGQNSEIRSVSWHPVHESLLLTGGYNGSLVYWLVDQTHTPHTLISDAHRQSIDVMAWHPSGHMVGTASHDSILKFWCREPPGSKLDPLFENIQENPPNFFYGPVDPSTSTTLIQQRFTNKQSGAEK